jgi:hypothetical protein
VINRWPLRSRLRFFFGFGIFLTLGGVAAIFAHEVAGAVLVFIVASALLLRGFIDLGRAKRDRDDA